MRKVRIALIDSGIQKNIFLNCNHIVNEYHCNSEHVITEDGSECIKSELHGTICAAIIQKTCELIEQIKEAKLDVALYGCPSGKTYSNCHNS